MTDWEVCQEAAAKGAKRLDEKRPGWAQRIQVERLNMFSGSQCILGQEYGQYQRGWRDVHPTGGDEPFAVAYGFTLEDPWQHNPTWNLLQAAWLKEIETRTKPLPAEVEGIVNLKQVVEELELVEV